MLLKVIVYPWYVHFIIFTATCQFGFLPVADMIIFLLRSLWTLAFSAWPPLYLFIWRAFSGWPNSTLFEHVPSQNAGELISPGVTVNHESMSDYSWHKNIPASSSLRKENSGAHFLYQFSGFPSEIEPQLLTVTPCLNSCSLPCLNSLLS